MQAIKPTVNLIAVMVVFGYGCGNSSSPPAKAVQDVVSRTQAAGYDVGFVGPRNLVNADSLSNHPGLTVIETTVSFPSQADGGEVYAWEFYAKSFKPVKLIIVRLSKGNVELIGESPMTIPRNIGINFFELPEPIPIQKFDKIGLLQPEEDSIPFKVVRNWETMISASTFERSFKDLNAFSVYGWRYAYRAHWRRVAGAGVE
mgnify:FL=1